MNENENKPQMLILGIAGGTGSGKTTLTDTLAARFSPDVTVIRHDDYYKAHDDMKFEDRCRLNYDIPEAFDNDLLLEHLAALRQWQKIECPIYDYADHNRSGKTKTALPKHIIIIEGILIFADERLRAFLDEKVFVDTDADVRIIRRIMRDVNERGRSLESITTQYLTTVKPMHEKYVEPSKKYADVVIPEGGENKVALEMLSSRLEKYLREAKITREN